MFGVDGELPDAALREAIDRYYTSVGFQRCVWNDLGAAVYRGEHWVLTVTTTFHPAVRDLLFLTVMNHYE